MRHSTKGGRIALPLAIILALTFFCQCSAEKNPAGTNVIPAKMNPALNETAMFLAGKELPASSALSAVTQEQWYKNYRADITGAWAKFQKPNLARMADWWTAKKPRTDTKTVFYPFSGPDVMNALTLFPDGDLYIMFGLEHPGRIPDATVMNSRDRHAGLVGLRKSLGTILNVNFFRTIGMAEDLGSASFNSITGILFYFLSVNDYTIIDARRIAVDAQSSIVDGIPSDDTYNWQNPAPGSRVPGIEITFRKGNGRIQKLQYFNLNIIDMALRTYSPHFIPYIESLAPFVTVIKSASYTMHNDRFTMIRGTILSKSDYIVEDDSGIPIRYLTADTWKVQYHGYFNLPVPLFNEPQLRQPDLKEAVKNNSTGDLPFSYGYNVVKSVLITAEKIKK